MKEPSVYLYDFRDEEHCLYLGDYTTAEGLRLMPPDSELRVRHIHTDDSVELPDHLAVPLSIDTIVHFIEATPSVVDFECAINEETTLSTHDDGEYHFRFANWEACEKTVRCSAAPAIAEVLWETLLANHSKYVTIDDQLVTSKFDTFDDYLSTLG